MTPKELLKEIEAIYGGQHFFLVETGFTRQALWFWTTGKRPIPLWLINYLRMRRDYASPERLERERITAWTTAHAEPKRKSKKR